MADLGCFKPILLALQTQLDKLVSNKYEKNHQYYKSTLEKLISRLLIKEEEEGGDGDDAVNVNHDANLAANRNQLLDKVKKELLHRGQYQEVDQKCQSFKSFINLMETNQLFKELRTDPSRMTGDLARDARGFNF
mmetsp:Transcript_1880/g.2828  ORF Transcript_1880/g.2828 Transcript_1880/m.2828 type:complete len:135 (+) Transcript_1880:296-700(+)|eukprot:CAMPEP_0170458648 /NCGR_PEP_ID=MMETSP0123-20130129/5559_1 /TAXON_ID=182087 /ORGANISM="Favella ehrenbergii, Strain Fehren 1" /LENGTH=134 /DNA_ID=CAMNT_0010722889 /DNA_START=1634 /DNA_END=2038 /DNA_ORIENTATION=-